MSKYIYVVTSGCYSDYHIVRCFLDKEKAEKYIKSCSDNDINDLEEYELDDDKEINPVNYVDVTYYFKDIPSHVNDQYRFKVVNSNSMDTDLNNIKFNYLWSNYFMFKRPIYSLNYDEDKLKNKYKKVCEDLVKQINYLSNVLGWDNKMIKNWFENNSEYIPESE